MYFIDRKLHQPCNCHPISDALKSSFLKIVPQTSQPAGRMTNYYLPLSVSNLQSLFFKHPAVNLTVPVHQFFRLEPQRHFIGAVLHAV